MNQITLNVPDTVSDQEAQFFLAAKLFEVGKLSLGKAAKLSGYTRGCFIELLSKMGVPVINSSPDDLEQELQL